MIINHISLNEKLARAERGKNKTISVDWEFGKQVREQRWSAILVCNTSALHHELNIHSLVFQNGTHMLGEN